MELPIQLAMKLGPVLRSPRAEIGLAYRHLVTGAAWTHNDRRFPAGNLILLPLVMAAYKAVADGRLQLPAMAGRPRTRSGATVRELIHRTLAHRDWGAANALLDAVGLAAVNATLAQWGLSRTAISGGIGPGAPHFTTPGEMAALIGRLATATDLSVEACQELLAYLRLAGPGSLPKKFSVRHDPAALANSGDGLCHASALVDGPGSHLLVVLTEGGIGDPAVGKVAATIAGYYAGVETNFERISDILEEERERKAADPRLVAWDVSARWDDGQLALVGRTSAPGWSEVLDRCREEADVPIVDKVRKLGATPPFAVAAAPVVHLRRRPAHAAEMVSQVAMGALLDVLEAGEEWWQVRSPDGTIAFVRSTNVQPATERDAERWRTREQLFISAPLVNAPRLTRGTVTLSAGTRLTFVGRRKDGLLGRTPGREEVVVPPADCIHLPSDAAAPELAPSELLALASRFLGVPYLWGGTSGWGVDCSGFTQLVLEMAGMRLPRDSDQQLALARKVGFVEKISELQPCDLVFFPGHVGLYLGRGEFIHASAQAGCVTVNALVPGAIHYSSSLAKKFLGGGRFLANLR